MNATEWIESFRLPPIPEDREEILETLSREIYGDLPAPVPVDYTVENESDSLAGKALLRSINVTLHLPNGDFTYPACVLIPKKVPRPRLFVNLAFRPMPDRYIPAEEIIDSGSAIAVLCYNDVTTDDADFSNGLAAFFPPDGPRRCGKIGLWAYAAQRLLDVLLSWDLFDPARIAVIGHSRLGKTALWCGATDERFSLSVSNDSGCSGASITRHKSGEDIEQIIMRFAYWFCDNYRNYVKGEDRLPFDQHWLLAAIAPRLVLVNSSKEDWWADPYNEFLSCMAAGERWQQMTGTGFVAPNRLPEPGDRFYDGPIGYAMRPGPHFFSREDWNSALNFWRRHEPQPELPEGVCTIREFRPDDAAAAAAIWNRVVDDGAAFPQVDPLNEAEAAAFFASQSFTGIAEDPVTGAVVGLYILHPNNVGRCGHIANASYAVAPESRGKGIGQALVAHSVQKGGELGFRIMQFNAVVANNAPALHIYEKLGFICLGTIPGGFRMKDDTCQNIVLFYRML